MKGKLNGDHLPLKLELLLRDAVAQVLEHEDPNRYICWLREHLQDYYSSTALDQFMEPQDFSSMVMSLGRAIWNATPLPGNNFRPLPLPEPGRNHPCTCGSGKKYKHCCAREPEMPAFNGQLLWPLVLEQLPRDTREHAIGRGQVPIQAIFDLAHQYYLRHQPKKGVSLLEPLFTGPIRKPDEAHDDALNLLCDLYDDLGHHKRKCPCCSDSLLPPTGRRCALAHCSAQPQSSWMKVIFRAPGKHSGRHSGMIPIL